MFDTRNNLQWIYLFYLFFVRERTKDETEIYCFLICIVCRLPSYRYTHTHTYHGSIQIEHTIFFVCWECYWRVTKNPLQRIQQNKIKQNKATRENKKKKNANQKQALTLLPSYLSILDPYCDGFDLDLLGLYANVNDIVSILMLVYVCFFSNMWFHSAPFSKLITQHSPSHMNKYAYKHHTQTTKQNGCVSCHSVALSQLSAKSNRIESNDEYVWGDSQANVDWLSRLVPAKSENKSLYVVVFDQVCFVFCLDLSLAYLFARLLARLLALWQRANEHASTSDCSPDFSFRRRFMLNQDKLVVLVCTSTYFAHNLYLYSIQI